MNPNFALDFRNDQIVLLHLQEGIWVKIGIVAVDDPDLEAALGYMRSTAMGLSPRGIASKLILPDAAILYTTLSNLSSDAKNRATEIALALIGRTPYDVADLAYDWIDEGATAHLAVIARETLDEAQAFASRHRFNPVAFAAWPEQGQFPGEADFGRKASATDIIAAISPQNISSAEAKPLGQDNVATLSASDFEMGDDAADLPNDIFVTQDSPEQNTAKETDNYDADQPAADDLGPEASVSITEPEIPFGNDQTSDDLVPSQYLAQSDEPEIVSDKAHILDAAEQDDDPWQDAEDHEPSEHGLPDPIQSNPIQSNPIQSDPIQPDLLTSDHLAEVGIQQDLPTISSFAAVSDISMVDVAEAPMALDVPIEESGPEDPARRSVRSAGKAQTLLAEFAARREAALGKSATSDRVQPILSAVKTAAPVMVPAPVAPQTIKSDTGTETPPQIVAATPEKTLRAPGSVMSSKPAVKGTPSKAGSKNSVFIGFLLTMLLLLALFAAGLMSGYLTAAWNSYEASTAVASYPPSIADEVAADLPDSMPPISAAPEIGDLSTSTPVSAPLTLPPPNVAMLSKVQSSLVPLVTANALPPPIVVAPPDETIPSAAIAPSGSPTTRSVAQGGVTPEGVFLIAAQPSIVDTPALDTNDSAQSGAVKETATLDKVTFADPALAGKKPVGRPEGLAPKLGNNPALAGSRPRQRPETVLAAGNAARLAAASLAQQQPNAPRSALAITISRFPVPRPKNLKVTVAVPQELALATPDLAAPDAAPPVLADNAAPNAPIEADNEPEVVASKSSGPRTVVSQNATYKNAINLSKINLIGVYGSQANRYALIRQSNGRFKKVYVGDRFDGGLVAAITDSELRYSKGGQMLALQMPNG